MQELTYPQFCEALVRLAQLRFHGTPGLNSRLHLLLSQHVLPLVEPSPPLAPICAFTATAAFTQYVVSVDPVLRLVFAAICKEPQVCNRMLQ